MLQGLIGQVLMDMAASSFFRKRSDKVLGVDVSES